MSPLWILFELRVMEVVVYRTCKAPVKMSPPTNQHPVFLQTGWTSCRPTNSIKALKETSESRIETRNWSFKFGVTIYYSPMHMKLSSPSSVRKSNGPTEYF